MYKYNILIDDWQRPLSKFYYLLCKVYKYNDHFVNDDNKCIANDIIDLCQHNCTRCITRVLVRIF